MHCLACLVFVFGSRPAVVGDSAGWPEFLLARTSASVHGSCTFFCTHVYVSSPPKSNVCQHVHVCASAKLMSIVCSDQVCVLTASQLCILWVLFLLSFIVVWLPIK